MELYFDREFLSSGCILTIATESRGTIFRFSRTLSIDRRTDRFVRNSSREMKLKGKRKKWILKCKTFKLSARGNAVPLLPRSTSRFLFPRNSSRRTDRSTRDVFDPVSLDSRSPVLYSMEFRIRSTLLENRTNSPWNRYCHTDLHPNLCPHIRHTNTCIRFVEI